MVPAGGTRHTSTLVIMLQRNNSNQLEGGVTSPPVDPDSSPNLPSYEQTMRRNVRFESSSYDVEKKPPPPEPYNQRDPYAVAPTTYSDYFNSALKEMSKTSSPVPPSSTGPPKFSTKDGRVVPYSASNLECLCAVSPGEDSVYGKTDPSRGGGNYSGESPSERAWKEYYNQQYEVLQNNRKQAERVRQDAEAVIRATNAQMKKNQENSNKRLKEYLHDVRFWKLELQREIQDMIDETQLLETSCKKRLETALMSLDLVRLICADNVNCRNRRTGMDNLRDTVEAELVKESELIRRVEHLLKITLDDVNEQYRRNMYEKEQLEFDWSDKKEAEEIGVKNAILHNGHPNKQFFPGVANMRAPHADPHLRVTAEEWAQASHNNLLRAESERLASKRLRALVDIILYETARDLRQQADLVEVALERHILKLIEALSRQEEELSKTLNEIVKLEKMCDALRDAIRAKDDFLKVAQTRLHNNKYRPNREDRVDTTQDQLVKEVMDISAAIDDLQEQLAKNQVMLDHLRHNQLVLEKDIEDKRNNIFIDREKVLHHRKRYPTIQRILGQTNCV